MAEQQQQTFIDLVILWISSCPARPHRCDAIAAMNFACVARNARRCQASAWGWRVLRKCELQHMNCLENVEMRHRQRMNRIAHVLDAYFNVVNTRSVERELYVVLGNALEHLGVLTRLLDRRPRLRAAIDALRPVARDSLGADELVDQAGSDYAPSVENSDDEMSE